MSFSLWILGQNREVLGSEDEGMCKYGDASNSSRLQAGIPSGSGLCGSIWTFAGVRTWGQFLCFVRHSGQSANSVLQATCSRYQVSLNQIFFIDILSEANLCLCFCCASEDPYDSPHLPITCSPVGMTINWCWRTSRVIWRCPCRRLWWHSTRTRWFLAGGIPLTFPSCPHPPTRRQPCGHCRQFKCEKRALINFSVANA